MHIFAGESRVAEKVDAAQPKDLRLLHQVLYGSDTTLSWIRRKVQKFENFGFDMHSPQFEARLSIIENTDVESIRTTCELLEIPIGKHDSTKQLAAAIMQKIFHLSDVSSARALAGASVGATSLSFLEQISPSLLDQPTEYGFTDQSRSSNPFYKVPSIADSKSSSRTVQVTVMRAKLDAEKRMAELEEQQARERRQRAEKVLKAEMELKIAEAALAEELAQMAAVNLHADQQFQNVQEVDPTDRVQQWIQDLQTHRSSSLKPSLERNLTQVQVGADGSQRSHDTQRSSSVNTDMLQITKSMQRMLARTAGGDSLPHFDGNVKEWPLFINQYRLTTEVGEYSGVENVVRLNKCLIGKAREAVQHMLMVSTDAEEIVKALELRFGRPELLLRALIQEIKALPAVTNWESFIEFDGVVRNVAAGVKGLKHHIYNPELLCLMLQKLPQYQTMMWGQFVTERNILEPTLIDFAGWVEQTAKYASCVNYTLAAGGMFEGSAQMNSGGYRQDNRKVDVKKCPVCQRDSHDIMSCDVFKDSDAKRRYQLAMENKLCFCCLRAHGGRCERRQQCPAEGCNRYHHGLLHKGEKPTVPVVSAQDKSGVNAVGSAHPKQYQALLRIIPVRIRGSKGVAVIPALLDEGSSLTIIDSDLARHLGITGYRKPLCCTLMGGSQRSDENSEVVQVDVGQNGSDKPFVTLKGVRTAKNFNLNGQRADVKEMIAKFPYVRTANLECLDGRPALLLIGQLHIKVIQATEVYQPDQHAPAISKCMLGWAVHGPYNVEHCDSQGVNVCCDGDDLHNLVSSYILLENMGVVQSKVDRQRSEDDRRALHIVEQSATYANGHFIVKLPYKVTTPFPESRKLALSRLKCTERKIQKLGLSEKYSEKMREYFSKGYAVPVTEEELKVKRSNLWYLPHFPVVNQMKPGKVRVVFDAAARSNGMCLNDALFSGPDLLKRLFGVLLRFRTGKIGFVADIAEMFHRIEIADEDSWSQCFVYREDPAERPKTYRMKAMTFGANSSPFIAQYIKNLNAERHTDSYPDACELIVNDHYVDDWLGSENDERRAAELIRDVIQVHKAGGFNIRNFRCSSEEVMNTIPKELRASIAASEIGDCQQRVLGLLWDSKGDCFLFSPTLNRIDTELLRSDRVPTKREMLSVIMSVYDPLGFVTPLTIRGRILMQQVWRSGIGWDDQLDEESRQKWNTWLRHLTAVADVRIPRCYCNNIEEGDKIELHVFCDTSSKAFAAVSYIRVVKANSEEFDVAFVSSRARVAPVRSMTIPKLELQAALLGYRLSLLIKEELHMKFDKVCYWTDSRTVICWLSTRKALKAFVANKVGEILEQSTPADWRWISTMDNVADEATRDTSTLNIQPEGRWFRGPDFLQRSEREWPVYPDPEETLEAHEEFSEELNAVNVVTESEPELPNALRFSKWRRLIRATACFYKSIAVWRRNATLPITPEDEEAAVKRWIKFVQNEQFPEELKALQSTTKLKPSSKLQRLSPFLDADGIMRAGGRLGNAKVNTAVRNPVILDGRGHPVKLLVQHYHCQANHHGREIVLNEIRQTYWIFGARSLLRTAIYSCQHCRVKNPQVLQPAMGQLPDCRLQPYCHPFTYCGMDFFGPFEVTVGRHREKRYGVIFTCMVTRAVHVEMANSLTTDSCILAIRRMIARRRKPDEMYSDNGTNLRGADRELTEALEHMSFSDVENAVLLRGIKWKFNPPTASHMGGSWERLIRSIRTALRETLKERAPRQEVLETVLVEAEHLVNSRPLTYVSADVDDPEALTPNHFLIGTTSNVQSPGEFNEYDLNWGRQWRKAQALIDWFWKRWLKEYLPTLVDKQKWTDQRSRLDPGDTVYVTDMVNERGRWPMGLVQQCYPGQDDVVRVVDVKTCSGTYRRPTVKLRKIMMEGNNEDNYRGDKPVSHPGGQCMETTASPDSD